jgi:hypothetical protein
MIKILDFIMETGAWIMIALSPTGILALAAFLLWANAGIPEWLAYGIAGIGLILGVWLAEYARRKHGCMAFLSRTSSSPDIP